MVQDGLTVDEALKVMDEGQRQPDRAAPMLPPKVLVVSSSSSDTDRQDFNYTSSSDDTEVYITQCINFVIETRLYLRIYTPAHTH